MLPLKIDKMTVSQWTCCDTVIGFGHALLRSYHFMQHFSVMGYSQDLHMIGVSKGNHGHALHLFSPHFLHCFASKTKSMVICGNFSLEYCSLFGS